VGTRVRLWLLSLVGAGLFAVSAVAWTDTATWWDVPGYLGMATAICAGFAALRFPRRAATWALVAGGATGIGGLFWAYILWIGATEGGGGAGYWALALVSLAAGIAGALVVRAAARGRVRATARAEILTLTLVLVAALIEAFAYEEGDGGLVGLTLIPAIVLGFALRQLRNEPPAPRAEVSDTQYRPLFGPPWKD